MELLVVRELTAQGDLILVFAGDGSPVWALDLESNLQWWFAEDDRAEVSHFIEEHRPSFATMPITAASYSGPHPAWELQRLAAGRRVVGVEAPVEHPIKPWLRDASQRFHRLSSGARILVVSGGGIAVFVLMSWLLSPFAAAPRPVDVSGQSSRPPTAGDVCETRGETADAPEGALLVCTNASRALSSELVWRSTG